MNAVNASQRLSQLSWGSIDWLIDFFEIQKITVNAWYKGGVEMHEIFRFLRLQRRHIHTHTHTQV